MTTARARGKEITPELRSERRQLCVDMVVLKARLAVAGLYSTFHTMDAAVKRIGYEVAELEAEK